MSRRARRTAVAALAALLAVATAMAAATPATAAGGKVHNAASNKCLTIAGGSTAPYALATQYDCDSHPSRLWTFEGDLGGSFQLRNVHSGLCLMPQSSGLLGVIDQYWCDSSHPARWWTVVDGPRFGVMFKNSYANLCLTPDAGSQQNNVRMVLWHCDDDSSRNWYAY